MFQKKVVALVGLPNVGKSSLFNRLVGYRAAVTHQRSGTTRDYLEQHSPLLQCTVVDTAGFEDTREFYASHLLTLEKVLSNAPVVLMLVDGKIGLRRSEATLAKHIRKHTIPRTPILLVMNKCDCKISQSHQDDFLTLGFGQSIAISAENNIGIDVLQEHISTRIETTNISSQKTIRTLVIGKPNVGKSSLINCLTRSNRCFTSEEPGTTRDVIPVIAHYKHRRFSLADSAGIRRFRTQDLEQLSTDQVLKYLQYIDIGLCLLDASKNIDVQSLKIGQKLLECHKPFLLVANKWDLVRDKSSTKKKLEELANRLLIGTPVVAVSATQTIQTHKIFPMLLEIERRNRTMLSLNQLQAWLASLELSPGQSPSGNAIRFKYVTQQKTSPPEICLFINTPKNYLERSYKRYLQNSLRRFFGLPGIPIIIKIIKSDNRYCT